MTIFAHEWRQGRKAMLVWALSCSALVIISMMVFPRIKNQMALVESMLNSMGALAKAFMPKELDYGTLLGFYALEAGNILSLGAGMYAAILGTNMLAKEEGRRTAEYLFPHPVSRSWVLIQKLLAMWLLLFLFVLITAGASIVSFRILNEPWSLRDFVEIHLGQYMLMVHMSGICFGISAFLRRESLGLGIGLALMLYFFQLLISLDTTIALFRYVTPYYYTQAARLVGEAGFDRFYVVLGMGVTLVCLLLGYIRYVRKDLHI